MKIIILFLITIIIWNIPSFSQDGHLLYPDTFFKSSNIYNNDNSPLHIEFTNDFVNAQSIDGALSLSIHENTDFSFALLYQLDLIENFKQKAPPSDIFYEYIKGDLLYYVPATVPFMRIYKPDGNTIYQLLIINNSAE